MAFSRPKRSTSSSPFSSPLFSRSPRRLRPRQHPSAKTSTSPSPSPKPSSLPVISPSNILLFLIAFRLLNALVVRTFFQPDEFFQSLEPAWQIAFGKDNGAWITWEWRHHLRSSLHPLLFSVVYSVTDVIARIFRFSPAIHADLLVAAPKTTQAVVAAVGDFYTWKLARRIYGNHSQEAWAALALTVLSPWQWFCSTRTLSNCLETTITIVALYYWPWQWSLDSAHSEQKRTPRKTSRRDAKENDAALLIRLRQCLALAALACILRPTNIIIWVSLAGVAWFRSTWDQRKILVREVLICGPAVLAVSTVADRLFYGVWTFPPLKFLYFNVAQSLSVFYGKNDFHYYISQGYPLLLTTALPFALLGLYRTLNRTQWSGTELSSAMRTQLAMICLIMPFVLSLISHKEVRFIYPLLPSLHILTAPSLVDYFLPALSRSSRAYMPRRLTLVFLLLANIVIALYTTIYHASGTLNVLTYLRQQHQMYTPIEGSAITTLDDSRSSTSQSGITAGFLMPCHSTPWRSHLVFPSIHAWALSCEPPVGLNEAQKAAYVDEADQFYENPSQFLQQNMQGGLRHVPRKPTYLSNPASKVTRQDVSTSHEWPDYLIFFAQLEPTLQSLLRSTSYAECWRTYNTAWHDDWRRRGDIIVWCLDPNEQAAWRSQTRKEEVHSREHHFDRVIEKIKKEATKKQKASSPWWGWKPSIPASSVPTYWPWERRKPKTVAGIPIPSWMTSSSWKMPSWKLSNPFARKPKKASVRDLWS